jgi:predicted RNA-binding Zn-ribbon protein involved in translation (DUF1610 family)
MKLSDITFPCYVIYADYVSGKIGHNGYAARHWHSANSVTYISYGGVIRTKYSQQFDFDPDAILPHLGYNHYIVDKMAADEISSRGVPIISTDWWNTMSRYTSTFMTPFLTNTPNKFACPICGGTGIEKVQLFTSVKEYPCSKCKAKPCG